MTPSVNKIFKAETPKHSFFVRPERQSAEAVEDYSVKKVIHTKELIVNGVTITGSPAGATSGAGAPASTPSNVGDFYIDTTNLVLYVAMGTSSSADWKGVLTA